MAGSLDHEFIDRAALRSGNIVLFAPEVAIDIAEEAKRQGLKVYGLTSFLIHPVRNIQPIQDYELDVEMSKDPHDEVIAHLRKCAGTSIFFEVSTE